MTTTPTYNNLLNNTAGEMVRKIVGKALKFEALLGVNQLDDCLVFLVKFHNIEQLMFVESSICNNIVPGMVIAFYEKRIVFED